MPTVKIPDPTPTPKPRAPREPITSPRPRPRAPEPPRPPKPEPRRPESQNRPFIGGYKKGGKVKKTGVALVHKGEHVVSAKRKAGRRKQVTRKA